MTLDSLNLVELNAQEVQEIEGGFIIEFLLGAFLAYLIYQL
jgi:hypothetical protein